MLTRNDGKNVNEVMIHAITMHLALTKIYAPIKALLREVNYSENMSLSWSKTTVITILVFPKCFH